MWPAVPMTMDFMEKSVYSGMNVESGSEPRAVSKHLRLLAAHGSLLVASCFDFRRLTENATIVFPQNDHGHSSHYSRNSARSRVDGGRIRAHQAAAWARTVIYRAWNLQRDVERALLVQIVASAFETTANAQPPCAARARRECRHHRYRRRLGLRVQDRVP